jgi:cytochrome c peroxidase
MNHSLQRRTLSALAFAFGALILCSFRGAQVDLRAGHSLGTPAVVSPPDNPITPEKVALGRKLFFDKRLSSNNTISCATCHDPNNGFADPHPVSVGVKGRQGERNSHTVLNVAFMVPLMWDGKAATLEEQ